MQGVTTAIVGFIFAALVFPKLIRHKTQYYAAVAAVVVIIFLDSISLVGSGGEEKGAFFSFVHFMMGILQIIAMVLLILAAGGLTVRELAGEVAGAIEVIRRGEEEKTVIVPLSGQKPKAKDEDEGRIVYEIDPATAEEMRRKMSQNPPSGPAAGGTAQGGTADSSIPLE
jgi:hypothetical protein